MTTPQIDSARIAEVAQPVADDGRGRETVFDVADLAVSYSGNVALKDVTLDIRKNFVTAFIGPSGCGKSTFIRCFNRMNDLIPGARVDGQVLYHGRDLYGSSVDPVEVRRRIGMVFQKPNPFPKSIYDNIAFGPRVLGMKKDLDGRVERSLRQAALWDEVKDRLKDNALGLSGGQQQRLCIARAIAVEPDVILMDEPASALDPISTSRIEDLIHELKQQFTIVIVTHNMQQAARVADMTAFFSVEVREDGTGRHGILVEHAQTTKIFTNPSDKRTEDYVTGRFGWSWRGSSTRRASTRSRRASRSRVTWCCGPSAGPSTRCRPRTSSSATRSSPSTTRSTSATTGSSGRSRRSSPSRRPSRPTCGLVLAVLHNSIHLERIGDQSVTVAKLTKLSADLETRHDLVEGLGEMGDRAEHMVRVALDSFGARDVVRARELVELDELIDRTNRRVVDQVLQMAAAPGQQEWGMRMIVVARCIERIGDNAVDIGEQTAFVVTGEFTEFTDASH